MKSGWDAVRERLLAVDAQLAGSFAPDQSTIDEVYRRRALQLAQRQAGGTVSKTFPVLVFRLGQEQYAIELSELAEVFAYSGCTQVPGAPPVIAGVINRRGEIGAVVNLRRILDLQTEDPAIGYVLMLRRHGAVLGFKVDRIEQVREIDPSQLISSGDGTTPLAHSAFVKGLTADTLILIDVAAALSHLFPQPT
jgi:purine-binding chemotaxis protein CheW